MSLSRTWEANGADPADVATVLLEIVLPTKMPGEVKPYLGQWSLSNTGRLRVRDVVKPLKKQARSAGLHFSVPAHVMLVVEVTRGPKTSDATMKKLLGWMEANGYRATGGYREIYIEFDAAKEGEAVTEIQYPVERAT